jgi:hypothetical protein
MGLVVHLVEDELLLPDPPDVARHEVDDEARRELEGDEAERDRHHLADDLHLRGHRGRRRAALRLALHGLTGLVEAGRDHQRDHDEVGQRPEEPVGDRVGLRRRDRQVHAQEVQALRVVAGLLGDVAADVVEKIGELAGRRDVVLRLAQQAEQGDEHRHLHQEGQTT